MTDKFKQQRTSLQVYSSVDGLIDKSKRLRISLQVYSSVDGLIDKFKRQPVPPEAQQAASAYQLPYQQQPAAVPSASAYASTQTAYPPANAQYAGVPYNAAVYPSAQYAAYQQPPAYPQAYAAAANGSQPSQGELSVPIHCQYSLELVCMSQQSSDI